MLRALAALALAAAFAAPAHANLIANGGFESGNTGFTSDYAVADMLWPEGTYNVGGNAQSFHPLWSPVTPVEGKLMLVVNGAPTPDARIWLSSPIAVTPFTTYYFQAQVASVYPTSPAVLAFSINGIQVGSDLTAGTVGDWRSFFTPWNSGAARSVTLGLVNRNIERSGNDFAIDAIGFDTTNPVPEPATLATLATGLLALTAFRPSHLTSVMRVRGRLPPAGSRGRALGLASVTHPPRLSGHVGIRPQGSCRPRGRPTPARPISRWSACWRTRPASSASPSACSPARTTSGWSRPRARAPSA